MWVWASLWVNINPPSHLSEFDVIIASGKGSSEIIQDVGTTVHLQCDALGNPTPEGTWTWSPILEKKKQKQKVSFKFTWSTIEVS